MKNGGPAGTDWTEWEVDLIVGDYFAMLGMELAGQPYVKAKRNAALQRLTGRSKGSIEFKHQNISAVLLALGMRWIPGYKPMANYQKALLDGIERHLAGSGAFFASPELPAAPALAEDAAIFFEPPPALAPSHPPDPHLARLLRRFDPAERDARNRALGKRGEERILLSEHARLRQAGRPDLARKVRWVAEEDGDGAGYDILSFDATGHERLLEVKTTIGHGTTPFYLSENERRLSGERPEAFRLVRLYDFARTPRAFQLAPPLEQAVSLQPTNWRASFGA